MKRLRKSADALRESVTQQKNLKLKPEQPIVAKPQALVLSSSEEDSSDSDSDSSTDSSSSSSEDIVAKLAAEIMKDRNAIGATISSIDSDSDSSSSISEALREISTVVKNPLLKLNGQYKVPQAMYVIP